MNPITIIGGGLAGLTLGIGLRQSSVPVTVLESGHYPRHRVCGEFISGEGQEVLARLGLAERLEEQGVCRAANARFVFGSNSGPIRNLPQPAICISRYKLDAMLAEMFQRMGGDLRLNTRATLNGLDEGKVRAAGRRAVPVHDGWAWYGLKIHARDFPLYADFEMHGFEYGYIGLCRLPDDEVNICGLFRKPAPPKEAHAARPAPLRPSRSCAGETATGCRRFAAEIPEASDLHQRFAQATLDEASFCSVAGLSLVPQNAITLAECSIGDALTMTPPVTGNGMSMAFESAELAIEPLRAYARSQISWAEAKNRIAGACDERFSSRLQWARWLQWMMLSRSFQRSFGNLALRSQLIWNTLFRQTR